MKRRRFSTRAPGRSGDRAYGKGNGGARRASLFVRCVLRPRAGGPEGDAPARAADEGEQVVDIGRAHLGFDARDGGGEIGARTEEDAEGGAERTQALAVEAGAAQPDAVEAAHGVRAVDDREGRQVTRGAREPAHDDEPPDPAVLVHDAVAGHEGLSSTTTCPPRVAPVAMMTPFPSLQLW